MGQARASRKKAVVISSDDEDSQDHALPPDASNDDEPAALQTRGNGKLKKPSRQQQSKSTKSPGKSPSKPRNKTGVKDQPKSNARPIYSFFNTKTQQRHVTPPATSENGDHAVQDESDGIQDESDDASRPSVAASKGSSVALAMRKRKAGHFESFESGATLAPTGSQKFRKASSGERVPSLSVFNEDKRSWTEQFAPADLSQLAVHKGKVSDVRRWLETATNGRRQRVLVLKGPAGAGKTATLRLLARDLGLELAEWRNPVVSDPTGEGITSTASQFQEFVARAGRSGGLQFSVDGCEEPTPAVELISDEQNAASQLLLIEEFPSTFSKTSSTLQSFRSTIMQYLSSSGLTDTTPTPIIMVISETLLSTSTALADSFTAHRLLGPELMNHPFLDIIEFNVVARTILAKALETVVVREARKSGRRKTPSPQIITQLSESGDIRSAISSLEFLCLHGDDGDTWSGKVTFTKQKKPKAEPKMTKFEENALKLICTRESTLGIFHAVGKVMYNKRQESRPVQDAHPPPWLPQHRRNKVWENDEDEILTGLGTDVSTFVAALHENYPLSCSIASTEGTLDSLLDCMHSISDADLLSLDRFSSASRAFSGSATDSVRQDEMAFHTAVRGLLFNFPYPVTRMPRPGGKRGDERQMFYPGSLKLWRKREEIEGTLELLTTRFQQGSIAGSQDADLLYAQATGVESWKKDSDNGAKVEAPTATDPSSVVRSSSARAEMLLERLPYMAEILGPRTSSRMLDSIYSIVRVRGTIIADEAEDFNEEEGADGQAAEQWTTDRPEVDDADKRKRARSGLTKGPGKGTEGAGLSMPFESQVESLVLEDDGIVDD